MCGIVAYIGEKKAVELLLKGLARLEYRGYDSAGVAISQNSDIRIVKSVGKVINLRNKVGDGIEGTMGIAHTRWATHGPPSDVNSHPHSSANKEVTVVHNGIIENFSAIRQDLQKHGFVFTTEVDSEVLPHLVLHMKATLKCDWPQAVANALKLCAGTFGATFMFRNEPDLLIAVRRGSPLMIGVGEGEYFVGSDASAFLEYTQKVVYLDEDDMAVIARSGYEIKNIDLVIIENVDHHMLTPSANETHPRITLRMELDEIEKGGYEHFMLKEIQHQPESLANCLRGRITKKSDDSSPLKYQVNMAALLEKNSDGTKSLSQMFQDCRKVTIIACGTSWHSALLGEYLFEQYARIPVEVEYASEFRYRRPIIDERDIVIGVSQSGETADTAEALRMSTKLGATTFGIVNSVGSTIARETHAGVYIHCGPEIGVASTKAFSGQVLVLVMLAIELARDRGTISAEEFNGFCEAILDLPNVIKKFLPKLKDIILTIARENRLANNFMFLGRGPNFPIALEGALKLKEISYIHAEGYPAAEMKHGPIALIDRLMPVVVIAPMDDTYLKVASNIEEVITRNGSVIMLTDEGNNDTGLRQKCDHVIECPSVKPILQPLINVIPLQLLAYEIARLRGCNIDMPRNLAKAVTVE
eukprot:GEMP01008125.1.p1 GENE.GEMP01008125.1~~GEMP01008125.1.p1  ORF type:complete len:644 (+),score=122.63 GEMP01008125.1:52-1983(+)